MVITCATRIAKFLKQEISQITNITILSDAEVALKQLYKQEDKCIFVKNRIKEMTSKEYVNDSGMEKRTHQIWQAETNKIFLLS